MFPDTERFLWLEDHTRAILERCRRVATSVPGYSSDPLTIYVPGGDNKYPSFWIRDAVMQCRSGLIDVSTMENMLGTILAHQNGPTQRPLAHGIRVDPWAIPDHINLPGLSTPEFDRTHPFGAVFYPGTYSPTDDQGDGTFGVRPADDDIYEVIELADSIVSALPEHARAAFLRREIKDVPIIERMHNGLQAMTIDEETGLCWNSPTDWSASNFHDSLKPMGAVALTSCLRFRAARTMAGFASMLADTALQQFYNAQADLIAHSVVSHLLTEDGWIMAASQVDRQPDVWSTSRAVYIGLLTGEHARRACQAMLRVYRDSTDELHPTISAWGYLRHAPTSADVVPGQMMWEHDRETTRNQYGVYQTGGYWPQPLGYYAYALAQVDMEAARQIAVEFIDHTRAHVSEGAPFEWLNPAIPLEQTPGLGRWYGPSATLPLEGFRRLSAMLA